GSRYLQHEGAAMAEWEFVAEVVRRAGCGLLLDVNNVWVNSVNHGFDPRRSLDSIAPGTVEEIHLAGFETDGKRLVDTHGTRVASEVWDLYAAAIERCGAR